MEAQVSFSAARSPVPKWVVFDEPVDQHQASTDKDIDSYYPFS